MRRTLVSVFLFLIGTVVAASAATAVSDYRQQRFIARNPTTLRALPGVRTDTGNVKQPYPARYYGDVSRGIQGCRWLMQRGIDTDNPNWVQRYRGCQQ
jgi:hypothetical protein